MMVCAVKMPWSAVGVMALSFTDERDLTETQDDI